MVNLTVNLTGSPGVRYIVKYIISERLIALGRATVPDSPACISDALPRRRQQRFPGSHASLLPAVAASL